MKIRWIIAALLITAPNWKHCTFPSTNEWINKLVLPPDGLWLSNAMEQTIDTHSNTDVSLEHHTEWKKPDAKHQSVQFRWYKMSRKQIYRLRKLRQWLPGVGGGRGDGLWGAGGMMESSRIVEMVAQLSQFTQNHWIVHLKQVNCMVCKFLLNKVVFKSQWKQKNVCGKMLRKIYKQCTYLDCKNIIF